MQAFPGDHGLRFEYTDRLSPPQNGTHFAYRLWLEASARDMDQQMRDAGYAPTGGPEGKT